MRERGGHLERGEEMAQGDIMACFAERLRWSEAATSVGRQERRDMSKISLPEREKPPGGRVSGESASGGEEVRDS